MADNSGKHGRTDGKKTRKDNSGNAGDEENHH